MTEVRVIVTTCPVLRCPQGRVIDTDGHDWSQLVPASYAMKFKAAGIGDVVPVDLFVRPFRVVAGRIVTTAARMTIADRAAALCAGHRIRLRLLREGHVVDARPALP